MRLWTSRSQAATGRLRVATSPGSDTVAALGHRGRSWILVPLVVAVTVLVAVDLVLLARAVVGLAGPW